ncbi:putative tryparedoxin 1 [Trypanosoma cruzi]|uniref:Tryparedoxin, putative n=1 Tax=Trypanosoma cruzi (strain CL Brener) TaxID=353153 RepID=Q4D1B8_TRYCC|nr:tryparedoxin, putative [Trypanosoma cruzi]EAN86318.1 tryparedoxin, putative [Trypanosoma cruzi]KAF8293500.1 putative tryparedoxin 1 [Trypanosoma cruzi]RNC37629.1 tryparedoxin [Trypanosoma cruzi]|eukprot:XP_808169.1 tryparedoxin [Trypanosoma cruzi strain CL Brener]
MSGLAKYLPSTIKLVSKSGTVSPISLAGKTVFFYFSASWCPPCRGFTPTLVEFYEKFRESKNFEVVLVTWDDEEEAYNGYFAKMPWLAIPFSSRAELEALRSTFGVETIPTVIAVNADTGAVVSTKGRERLLTDPEGKNFPWSD